MLKEIEFNSKYRTELIDISSEVKAFARDFTGVITVFCPHTTAAITINENGDPAVKRDILWKLSQLSPVHAEYHHSEGNSDAHIKASLLGSSENVIVENGKVILGTWQSIYFCEFDGPRKRKVILKK
jgi:secondary thiamine-phosphate synthase enzyme